MNRRIWLLFAFIFTGMMRAKAGEGEYAVILIKPDLTKNAHAVVRYDDLKVEIKSDNDLVIRTKWVVTVLDAEGDSHAQINEYYDKFTEIADIDGALYDAWGKKIKSVKKSDISDESGVSAISLMEDFRIKRHSFNYKNYPYTVMYEVVKHLKSSMFLPSWDPQSGYYMGIEQSSCTVVTPQNYELRYKLFNGAGKPEISQLENKRTYHWEMRNLRAISKIFATPGWRHVAPLVYLGPTNFAIDDFKGNMSDWQQYGASMYKLVAGRDELPPAVKQKVHELTDGITDTRERVKRLYAYLQSTTRYISIQLGIGGWQPYDAKYVSAKGYGDCKALSNFMFSLLKEAGIKSYYTIVTAGEWAEDMIPDFANAYFNHAILCVPLKSDSIWLECTSQTESAGYMGNFTGNRHALLVTEEGGKMVSTPTYDFTKNLRIRIVNSKIDAGGDLYLTEKSRYQAVKQDDIYIHEWSNEEKMKYVRTKFDLGTYDVSKFNFEEHKGEIPVIIETMDIDARNYASVSGKRIFIVPNLLSKSGLKLLPDEDRKYDLRLPVGFTEIDSVEITLPPGYVPESMPENLNLETKFGTYTTSVKVNGDKLTYYRMFQNKGGYFASTEYSGLVQFFNDVYKADRDKVVLVKKE